MHGSDKLNGWKVKNIIPCAKKKASTVYEIEKRVTKRVLTTYRHIVKVENLGKSIFQKEKENRTWFHQKVTCPSFTAQYQM